MILLKGFIKYLILGIVIVCIFYGITHLGGIIEEAIFEGKDTTYLEQAGTNITSDEYQRIKEEEYVRASGVTEVMFSVVWLVLSLFVVSIVVTIYIYKTTTGGKYKHMKLNKEEKGLTRSEITEWYESKGSKRRDVHNWSDTSKGE